MCDDKEVVLSGKKAARKIKMSSERWWVISQKNDSGVIFQEDFPEESSAKACILDVEKDPNMEIIAVHFGKSFLHEIEVKLDCV